MGKFVTQSLGKSGFGGAFVAMGKYDGNVALNGAR